MHVVYDRGIEIIIVVNTLPVKIKLHLSAPVACGLWRRLKIVHAHS